VARGRFYVTTRVNSDKWGKGAEKKGLVGISSQVYGIFRGFLGRYPVLGQAAWNCLGKHPPQKKGCFFNQSWVLGLFLEVSEVYEGPKVPEVPEGPIEFINLDTFLKAIASILPGA
jgi:hypothetical protein